MKENSWQNLAVFWEIVCSGGSAKYSINHGHELHWSGVEWSRPAGYRVGPTPACCAHQRPTTACHKDKELWKQILKLTAPYTL